MENERSEKEILERSALLLEQLANREKRPMYRILFEALQFYADQPVAAAN
jgi:hypothetical protein